MSIKVIVSGARGKMGVVTVNAIEAAKDLELVAQTDMQDDLANAIKSNRADVVVDFTLPDCVFKNTQTIIEQNARPVIGTTGLMPDQIEALQKQCEKHHVGGIIAPNFSLGAVLMMRYAADAAKYLSNAEIIEMHHAQKVDAPSGTAKKTAEMMQKENIPIHSVRLPGLFAHQAVIFGGDGETLTIRHDGMDRNAMMPGVLLACRKVMELDRLVYGLENIL